MSNMLLLTWNKYIITYGERYKIISMYAEGWHVSTAVPKGS